MVVFSEKFGDRGFTLIELLMVVALIAILMAIAVPQFRQYRNTTANAAAHSDIKNGRLSMEAYFGTHSMYPYLAESP